MPDPDRRPEPQAGECPPPGGSQAPTASYLAPADGATPGARPPLASCKVPPGLENHHRYQVLELLGAGGMGCVYKARHQFMDRLVALKVINHDLVDRPDMVARFFQEVRAAARLAHPNIVRAYDADQAGDDYFLVMEFVPGVNLDQVVAERGPLPVAEACDYARQAAQGLEHAFAGGMVHRDIKPHNLMRTAEGLVKILDFGLAHYASEVAAHPADRAEAPGLRPEEFLRGAATAPGRPRPVPWELVYTYPGVGTPDYIAPEEVLDARQADIRADIYSLGCTLYRFLTGQVPFPRGTPVDKLRSHLECAPEPLERLRPGVPADLADVVARMMAKEAARRFQTPAEVAQALTPFTGPARRHILVVEDDAVIREAVALALEDEGYGVTRAAHGREALERLATTPLPDLILLDMMMPVMDGWEFLYRLKQDRALAGIPVVVVSAAEQNRAREIALGAVDYVQKPIAIDALADRVKNLAQPR